MGVLAQIVETISKLAGDGATDNLSIENESQPIALLLPDLRKFHIFQSQDGSAYTVYLVVEDPENNGLNLTASLAGFYNARYVYEFLKYDRIKVPIGAYKFFVRKRCNGHEDQ
jgi:hypothetical protein